MRDRLRRVELMSTKTDDLRMMELALGQARDAAARGEVPVGAVLVDGDGRLLATAGNNCVGASDPAGHAEMLVLRQAAGILGNYRLVGATLYVTLEPCAMCAAAMVHARIERLVFGAADPKAGAIISRYRIGTDGVLNHRFVVSGGILEVECGRLLKDFFRNRRR
ncbi:tRNA-specific adenosine-34 deaminase [hydrothermal vent metagenome]|uniref:tRNA-specific adenosine deaminase 2 n=1 Tax=hydrothermal vent metagenome TaxID=652676 RepID=A0A3B0WDS6_9ZZZZ